MELQPNFHWINMGSVNVYLAVDEDGLTLFDSGMPNQDGLILDYIKKLGRKPADLVRILITHADIDHAGSMAAVQAQTGAKIYASAGSVPHLISGRSPKHMPFIAQFVLDNFSRFRFPMVGERVIEVVQDGQELPVLGGLQVLATPGHTLDHISFYSPSTGILITGDALNNFSDRLQLTPRLITADMELARQSAARLLKLAPGVFACGHGRPVQDHTADTIMALYAKL